MSKLKLNLEETHKTLVKFLKEKIEATGMKKAVFGLSGGIDSALVAYLIRDALGAEMYLL